MAPPLRSITVASVMSRELVTCKELDLVTTVEQVMRARQSAASWSSTIGQAARHGLDQRHRAGGDRGQAPSADVASTLAAISRPRLVHPHRGVSAPRTAKDRTRLPGADGWHVRCSRSESEKDTTMRATSIRRSRSCSSPPAPAAMPLPATPAGASSWNDGYPAAVTAFPPGRPAGTVELASFGLVELIPAEVPPMIALHARIAVTNNASERPWNVDIAGATLLVNGSEARTLLANSDLPTLPIALIGRGEVRTIDLYFAPPAGIRDEEDLAGARRARAGRCPRPALGRVRAHFRGASPGADRPAQGRGAGGWLGELLRPDPSYAWPSFHRSSGAIAPKAPVHAVVIRLPRWQRAPLPRSAHSGERSPWGHRRYPRGTLTESNSLPSAVDGVEHQLIGPHLGVDEVDDVHAEVGEAPSVPTGRVPTPPPPVTMYWTAALRDHALVVVVVARQHEAGRWCFSSTGPARSAARSARPWPPDSTSACGSRRSSTAARSRARSASSQRACVA